MRMVGIEPTVPPPSRSAVRHTNHCATAPFPKKNGLDAAYIMRRLSRHGSFATVAAQQYHGRCKSELAA